MIYHFFRSQIDYIFFLYGLSFFILAGACFLLAKNKKKDIPWFWLGLFGLVHATNEWLDLIAIVIGDSFIFQVIRLIVLTVSFVLLIEFGRRGLSNLVVRSVGLWFYIPILSLIYLGWLRNGFQGANFVAHAVLGFIASLSASVVFFILFYKAKQEFKPWLCLTGIAFGFYAFTKLVIPQPPHFLFGTLFNQDIFFSFFSFPIQLLRCALAMLCSLALWMYWYSSQLWTDLNLPTFKKRSHIVWIIFLYFSFVILGWVITEGVSQYYKQLTSKDFIAKAATGAAAVNPRRILTLSASATDLGNPDYVRLKEQIGEIKKANEYLTFVYLMRLQDDKVILLADSDQPSSPDYSPPGQVYKDAPLELKEKFFKPEVFILGPYTDKWGTWVSAYAPIIDFDTQDVVSRIGMDIRLAVFQGRLFHHRVVGILIVFGLFILLISIFIIIELNKIVVNKVVYSQRHLQVLLDNIPNPVYYKSKEGIYLGCNLATEQFLGLAKDKIVGNTVFDIFSDKAVAQKYREMDEALFNQPGIQIYEHKLRNADGTDHDVIFNRSTYPGPDGKIAGLVGVIIDVTEQKRAENSLRRLAAIVESSDDAIIGKDINGIITSWNHGAEKIYGYFAKEAIGRSINLIVSPEIKNETVFIFDKIKNGEHIEHYETVRITKDGNRLNMSLTISPLKDDSGKIIGASVIGRDITERKIMEDELKRKTELLEAQKEASLDGLLVVDENGQKILTNKRLLELWQVPQHIADDKNDKALLEYVVSRAKNPQQFLDKVNYLYAHKEEKSKDEIEFKDGMVFERYSSPVMDKNGKYFGRIWTFRDISKRVKVEARINKLSKIQGALLNPGKIEEKLKIMTDGVVDIFEADFCRIWLMGPPDRCNSGCPHASVREGPHVCVDRKHCLHLVSSSGRYAHIDGGAHSRVPFGCYKIGGIASGEYPSFLTNDVARDPRVHDHEWAAKLGLVSFAGFRLGLSGGETIGVLALFSKHAISSEEYVLLKIISNIAIRVVKSSQAEEGLKSNEERFRQLFESSRDAIMTMDRDGYVDCKSESLRLF
ncbi:MAG: PAS domain S-box protein, partial [Candidatus Omnitrophica bacterium]|nr:PAS domain S-box protein [Candidatus Omnitrophota bacterium]